jgi:hypothetical protein
MQIDRLAAPLDLEDQRHPSLGRRDRLVRFPGAAHRAAVDLQQAIAMPLTRE